MAQRRVSDSGIKWQSGADEKDSDGLQALRTDSGGRNSRKHATMPSLTEKNRHADCNVRPEKLAQLHKMHEMFLKYATAGTPTAGAIETTEEALEEAWGVNGSWLIYGELPTGSEKPKSVRSFHACPKNSQAWISMGGAAINTKGQKGIRDKSIGQDNFSISRLQSGWDLLCVMDGHGEHGEWPSTQAVRTLPYFLQSKSCSQMIQNGEIEAALIMTFDKTQKDLVRHSRNDDIDIQASGCTAVAVLMHESKQSVFTAFAGDSRAVLLVPGLGAVKETRDHKPSVESEAKRIRASGGDVIITTHEDGWVEERINIRGEDFPGISMTRSFGDLCVKEVGVNAEPEVVEWSVAEYKEAYLFVATDGVWEFLDTATVAAQVLSDLEKGMTCDQAVKHTLEEARAAWAKNEGMYCDDITMILMPVSGKRRAKSDGLCAAGICKACSVM